MVVSRVKPFASRPALLMAPVAVFLLVAYVGPVAWSLAQSFIEPSPGFGNFIEVLGSAVYRRTIGTTLQISAIVAALCLLIAYPTALFITQCRPAWSRVLVALVIVPFFTSLLVRNYAWIFLLGNKGIINSALLYLGIVDQPLKLMYNRFGVVLGMTHVLLPYTIMLLINVLRGLDPNLSKSAASLGSGAFSIFRQIVLPMTRSGAGAGFLLVFVLSLAFFVTPAMLGSPRETMIANEIAAEVSFLKWGIAATLGTVLLVITLAALAVMQWLFGGMKLIAPGLAEGQDSGNTRSRGVSGALWWWLDRLLNPVWPSLVRCVGILALVFLILPLVLVVVLSLNDAEYFSFPPQTWSLRWYANYFDDRRWMDATLNSFKIGAITALLSVVLSVPAALAVARSKSRWSVAGYLLAVSPLIVPSVIVATSVFFAFTAMGLPRSTGSIVLGHTIGAIPFAMVVMVTAFTAFDWKLERAARSLGASPFRALLKIVLPLVGGSVATAALLAFLHSFDELLISLFMGGLRLETLPRKMWESLQEINPTIAAVSTLLIGFILIVLALLQLLERRQIVKQEGNS